MSNANGLGWVQVPIVPVIEGINRKLKTQIEEPASESGKRAGEAIKKNLAAGADAAAREVQTANRKVRQSTEKVKDEEAKLSKERNRAEAAAILLANAEEKVAKLKQSGAATADQLARAESDLLKKRGDMDTITRAVEKQESALEAAKQRQENATKGLTVAEELHRKALADAENATQEYTSATEDADGASARFELSLGKLAAAGTVAVGAFAAGGKALYEVGETFDDAYDTIRIGTGASGEAFEELQQSMRNVAANSIGVGSDLGEIGTTLADLNTRLGVTGEPLEKLTAQFQQLKGMGMETDINAMAGAFQQFGVEVEDMPDMLDRVMQISQATGRDMNGLVTNLAKSGPALREFGFGLEESAGLMGALDKAGLDADKTLNSMTRALGEFAKEGKNPQEALWGMIQQIEQLQKSGKSMEALDLANSIFGARGGAGFLAAVESGTFAYEDFMESLGASDDTIASLAEETADFAERWDQLKLKALLAIEPIATQVFDSMVPALELAQDVTGAVVDRLKAFGEWVQKNTDWLAPLGVGLSVAAAGLAAIVVQQKIVAAGGLLKWIVETTKVTKVWTAVTKAQAAAQRLLNAAMKNNVLGLIITGIAAVVAGLTYFFTKTEKGQELWKRFTESMSAGIEWGQEKWAEFTGFFGDAWQNTQDAVSAGWESLKAGWEGVTGFFGDAWQSTQDSLSAGWENLKAGWADVTGFFGDMWQGAVDGVAAGWDWLQTKWTQATEWLQQRATSVADFVTDKFSVVGDAFAALGNLLKTVYDATIAPIFEVFQNLVGIAKDLITGDFDGISDKFQNIAGIIQDTITSKIAAAMDAFKDLVARMVAAVGDKLADLVQAFKQMPAKIQRIFADAGTWLIDAGKNMVRGLINGIKSMAGAVGDAVRWIIPDRVERFIPGLHFGGMLPTYARGGVLPDIPGIPRSVRDPILGVTSAGRPIARIEPGEFVVNRDATKEFLPLLHAINNGLLDPHHGDMGLPGYANGGVVTAQELLNFAWGKPVNGKQAPFPLEGAKYMWGEGLLRNWGDCSGAISGLAALAIGMEIAGRKFATMSQGQWLGSHGFTRGTSPGKNAFEIGFFNGGPYGGHTSGTIYGPDGQATNVEMGGARGNGQIGGRAAGSRHSQYTDRYWIGLKGAAEAALATGEVLSTSIAGIKTTTGHTIDWGTASQLASQWDADTARRAKLRRYSAGIFDTGGILLPDSVAINRSGKPERVLDPRMTVAFERIADYMPAMADAMARFTGVDWAIVGEEMASAWRGEDFGYGEIAHAVGEKVADRIATEVGFLGEQMRDIQSGASVGAYLASLSPTGAVGLADQVGQVFGVSQIGSLFGGVAKSYEVLQDAAVMQVDATSAVIQAERNLAAARANAATASGEDQKAALEAVTAAERDYTKALDVVGMAAAATGQAQVAMALEVVKVVVGIGKAIAELVEKIRRSYVEAYRALAAGMDVIAQWSELVHEWQSHVSSLQQKLIRNANEQRAAERALLVATHDRMIKQATADIDVAKARQELDKEIARGAQIAYLKMRGLHEDWDSYLAYQAMVAQGVLHEWSDQAISQLFRYEAARANAAKAELEGRMEQIRAEAALAAAARQNARTQIDLVKAQERLIKMSAKVAGVDLVEATAGSQLAKLLAQLAEVQAGMDADWKGRLGYQMGATGKHANEYRGRLAQHSSIQSAIDAVLAETGMTLPGGSEYNRMLQQMAYVQRHGGDPLNVARTFMPKLAEAEAALMKQGALKPIWDAQDKHESDNRQIEDFLAELDQYSKVSPLEDAIKGLEHTIQTLNHSAEGFADGNKQLRGEYLRAADQNRRAAESLGVRWKLDETYASGNLTERIAKETTVYLDGEKMYTAKQIDDLLAMVTAGTSASYKIKSASEVTATRRRELI